jgi:cysteinyl-tRNA synthetase
VQSRRQCAPYDGREAMELKLYDTLSREKRAFAPIDEKRVRMYVCGPTVYDFAHIGNARPVIVFDVLFRLLRHIYGADHVSYVRNITDVDDKINARAAERGIAIRDLTEETYANYKADVKALRCLPPTVEPRATEYIRRDDGKTDMITLIDALIKSDNAYVAEGHALFHVPSMPDYGKLSKRSLDEMLAGARVEVAPYKRDPMDFVLWKPSKPGEPAWESPWGPGRPGWHIECSAMSAALLGKTFDIHGGGIDLVFPHHENEIAQSRCAFHTGVMASYWMHNGHLQVEGEKMSKSLGNFVTIRELLRTKTFGGRKWQGGLLKIAMLQTQYQQPIDWTVRLLEQTEARLERWKSFAAERTVRRENSDLMNAFLEALADDLNTPKAFSILDQAISREASADEDRYTIYKILKFLGLVPQKARVAVVAGHSQNLIQAIGNFSRNEWDNFFATVANRPTFKSGGAKPETKLLASLMALAELWHALEAKNEKNVWPPLIYELKRQQLDKARPPETDFELRVRRLITARNDARNAKNFAESDRIRDELAAMGVVVKDSKEGTTWETAR